MAAAAVAGLIPVLHSVAGDKSRYYIGRQLWFGFIAVYGVVVYVVRMPWVPIHEDFWCHGNITNTCLIECFEKSFNSPVVGIWYFFFFIFLALFFLMEFFMAQIRHKQIKAKSVESAAGEMEEGSMVGIQENAPSPKKSILNFHQEKTLLLLYLLYFLLQHQELSRTLFLPDQGDHGEANVHLHPHHLILHDHPLLFRFLHVQHPPLPAKRACQC
uniref:Connexin N-terminal domain-containing protein n=1 Tax=Felis catus TaxID=9685 RepID=A0ABI8A1I1_FELCA